MIIKNACAQQFIPTDKILNFLVSCVVAPSFFGPIKTPALFTAHGCFYRQRTLASSFHCFMKLLKVALNSCEYFRVNSKRSLQIALIVVPLVVPKIPVESTALLKF